MFMKCRLISFCLASGLAGQYRVIGGMPHSIVSSRSGLEYDKHGSQAHAPAPPVSGRAPEHRGRFSGRGSVLRQQTANQTLILFARNEHERSSS